MVAPEPAGSEWLADGFGPRSTLLPGVSEVLESEERSAHFKSLAHACSEEVNRLLKYNVRNRIAAHGCSDGDADIKHMEKAIGCALSEILNRLGSYFDHAMVCINGGVAREDESLESAILRKQLARVVSHVEGLQKELETSNAKCADSGDMFRRMRRDFLVDQQQQRQRYKAMLLKSLVHMNEEEIEDMIQAEMAVSVFNQDEFVDVDSKDMLKRKAKELHEQFAVERHALQKKLTNTERDLDDTTGKLQKAEDRIHSLTIQMKTMKMINKTRAKSKKDAAGETSIAPGTVAEEESESEDEDELQAPSATQEPGSRGLKQQVIQYELAITEAITKSEQAIPLIGQMQHNIGEVRPDVMLRELSSRFANLAEGLRDSQNESYMSEEDKETMKDKREIEELKNQLFMSNEQLEAAQASPGKRGSVAGGRTSVAAMPESDAIAKLKAEVARLRDLADEGKSAKRELRRLQEQRNSIDAGSLIGLKQEALEWEMVEQFELEMADVKNALAQADQVTTELETTNHELKKLLEEAEQRAIEHGAPATRQVTDFLHKLKNAKYNRPKKQLLPDSEESEPAATSDLKEEEEEEDQKADSDSDKSENETVAKPEMRTIETQTDPFGDEQNTPQTIRKAVQPKSFNFQNLDDSMMMPDADGQRGNSKGSAGPPTSADQGASGSTFQDGVGELASRSIDDWGESALPSSRQRRGAAAQQTGEREMTDITPGSTMRDSRGPGNSWTPGMGSTTGWRMREKVWLVKQREILSKAIRQERQRLYRAWPRAASADTPSRRRRSSAESAVDEEDGEKVSPFSNSAEEIMGHMEEEAMFQRNEALSKVDSARLLSFCFTNKNNEIGEDPRNVLECPELLEYYQCTELMYRRMLDQAHSMGNLQERCDAALFDLDRRNTELCHLKQSFIERVSDEMLAWEVQRTWLRRCKTVINKAGFQLDIPVELLSSTCTRENILKVIEHLVSADEDGIIAKKFETQAERLKIRVAQDIENMRVESKQRCDDISSVLRKFRSKLPTSAGGFLTNDDGTLLEGSSDGRQRSLSVHTLLTKLREDADAGEETRHGEIFEALLEREQRCIELYQDNTDENSSRVMKGERTAAVDFLEWLEEMEQFWESQGEGVDALPEEDDNDEDYLESIMPASVQAGYALKNMRHTLLKKSSLKWDASEIMESNVSLEQLDQILDDNYDDGEGGSLRVSLQKGRKLKMTKPAWLRHSQKPAHDPEMEEIMAKVKEEEEKDNEAVDPLDDDSQAGSRTLRTGRRGSILVSLGAIDCKDESGNFISLQDSACEPDMEEPGRERCKFTRKLPPMTGGIRISTQLTQEPHHISEVIEITEEAEAEKLLQEVWIRETRRKSIQKNKQDKKSAQSNVSSKKKLQQITDALDLNSFRSPKFDRIESEVTVADNRLKKMRKSALNFPVMKTKHAHVGGEDGGSDGSGDETEMSMRSETDVTYDGSDDDGTDSSAQRGQPKSKAAKLRLARAMKKSVVLAAPVTANSVTSKNFKKALDKKKMKEVGKSPKKPRAGRIEDDEGSGSDDDGEAAKSRNKVKTVPEPKPGARKLLKKAMTFHSTARLHDSPREKTKKRRGQKGKDHEDDEREDDTIHEEDEEDGDDHGEQEEHGESSDVKEKKQKARKQSEDEDDIEEAASGSQERKQARKNSLEDGTQIAKNGKKPRHSELNEESWNRFTEGLSEFGDDDEEEDASSWRPQRETDVEESTKETDVEESTMSPLKQARLKAIALRKKNKKKQKPQQEDDTDYGVESEEDGRNAIALRKKNKKKEKPQQEDDIDYGVESEEDGRNEGDGETKEKTRSTARPRRSPGETDSVPQQGAPSGVAKSSSRRQEAASEDSEEDETGYQERKQARKNPRSSLEDVTQITKNGKKTRKKADVEEIHSEKEEIEESRSRSPSKSRAEPRENVTTREDYDEKEGAESEQEGDQLTYIDSDAESNEHTKEHEEPEDHDFQSEAENLRIPIEKNRNGSKKSAEKAIPRQGKDSKSSTQRTKASLHDEAVERGERTPVKRSERTPKANSKSPVPKANVPEEKVRKIDLESIGIRAPTPPPPKVMKTQGIQTDAPVVDRDESTRRLKPKKNVVKNVVKDLLKNLEQQQEGQDLQQGSVEAAEEPVEVIDSGQQCEMPWLQLPEEVLTWLKLNLFRKQQAEHYYLDWAVSEIGSFDKLEVQKRQKIIKDFEDFLDNELCMIRPTKHKVRRGLRRKIDLGDENLEGDAAEGGADAGNLQKTLAQARLKAVMAASMLKNGSDSDKEVNFTEQKAGKQGTQMDAAEDIMKMGPRRPLVWSPTKAIKKVLANTIPGLEIGPQRAQMDSRRPKQPSSGLETASNLITQDEVNAAASGKRSGNETEGIPAFDNLGETGGTQETSKVEMEVASGDLMNAHAPSPPPFKKQGRNGRQGTDLDGRPRADETYEALQYGQGKSDATIAPFGSYRGRRLLNGSKGSKELAFDPYNAELQMQRRQNQAQRLETMKNHRLPKPPMGIGDFLSQLESVDREVKDLLTFTEDEGQFKEQLEPLKKFLVSVAKGKNSDFKGMTDDVIRLYSSLEDAGRAIHDQERTQHVHDAIAVVQEVASKEEVRMKWLTIAGKNIPDSESDNESDEIQDVMTHKAVAVPHIRGRQGSPPQAAGRQNGLREPAPPADLRMRPPNAPSSNFVGCVAWSYAGRNPERGNFGPPPEPPPESSGMGWTGEGWHKKPSVAKAPALPSINRSNSNGESPPGHPFGYPNTARVDGSRRLCIDSNVGPLSSR